VNVHGYGYEKMRDCGHVSACVNGHEYVREHVRGDLPESAYIVRDDAKVLTME